MHDLQHAYIIDMGFATLQTDETILFAGAVQTASNRVLEALQKKEERFQYKFADDLESLVKVSLLPLIVVALLSLLSFNYLLTLCVYLLAHPILEQASGFLVSSPYFV